VIAGPTQLSNLQQTGQALVQTQAAIRVPQVETQAAILRATAGALLETEAAERFPLTLTQAAVFRDTAQASIVQGTLVPPALGSQVVGLAMTAQAAASTQAALLQATPLPPQVSELRRPINHQSPRLSFIGCVTATCYRRSPASLAFQARKSSP